MTMIEGGCGCGAVHYASSDTPINVRACHCKACRRTTGGPYLARALVPLAGVEISGPVGWYATSAALERGFCQQCGTSLFTRRTQAGVIGLLLSTIETREGPSDALRPTEHVWVSEKLPWVTIEPGVAQYRQAAPA